MLAERVGNKLGGVRDNTNYVLKCPARFGRLENKYSSREVFLGKYFSVFFFFFLAAATIVKGVLLGFHFHQKESLLYFFL